MDPDDLPFACEDSLITTQIDGAPFIDAKMAALAAHRTQVTVDGGFFALSNNLGSQVWGTEHYRLARGTVHPDAADGKESDLFAGIG